MTKLDVTLFEKVCNWQSRKKGEVSWLRANSLQTRPRTGLLSLVHWQRPLGCKRKEVKRQNLRLTRPTVEQVQRVSPSHNTAAKQN